ncbi:MAG: hypothetical protein EBX53_10035, partial [Betaproteobacteria bacterium]|nr:hypothetical protein [Betaproteobacteria bacterium]NDH30645.1 hypothetical protein [Betaproteobacteria bacterium]
QVKLAPARVCTAGTPYTDKEQTMIAIDGLTKNQRIIAEFMWNKCHTQGDVEAVLRHYGPDARIVYEMITAASLDQYMATDLANELLQRYMA